MCRILCIAVGLAAILPVTSASSQDEPHSVARPLEGPPFEATLRRIEPDRLVLAAQDKERTIALDDLLLWGRPADVRRGSYLLLVDGGVVAGEVKAITADQVQLESTHRPGLWKANRLARGSVRGIVYQSSAHPQERDRWEARAFASGGTQDRLLLVSGDMLAGTLLESMPAAESGEASSTLRFLPAGGKEVLSVPLDRVIAIALADKTAGREAPRETDSRDFWLGLADGSLLRASAVETKDDTISITLAGGRSLQARSIDDDVEPPEPFTSRVVFVQPLSARVVFLSDLKTIGFKHVPLLDWPAEHATDRSVARSRLRAGGQRFLKGIGMPATSRLAYDVPAGARRFEAEIAVDDAAERAGSVVFRVYLEAAGGTWQAAYESKIVRGGDAPQFVRVELGSAERLALVVDMADHGDARDWADWLNARFVK